jgi:ferredoxin-NADP reductase
MLTYLVKLVGREEVAEGTMAFHLEKPVGFNFKAGQFISLRLIDPPETDAEGNTRVFSIASAPYEGGLMIATRMRNTAFKRTMKALPLGAEIQMQGPFGSLTLDNESTRPAVLIAGGIGITPFRSIVFHASHNRAAHRIFLFYSNRRPEDAAFINELQAIEKTNSNFKLVATMTGGSESVKLWRGERGVIDKVMLAKVVRQVTEPKYYVAGPPGMVNSLKSLLQSLGVESDQIHVEQFAGYE